MGRDTQAGRRASQCVTNGKAFALLTNRHRYYKYTIRFCLLPASMDQTNQRPLSRAEPNSIHY